MTDNIKRILIELYGLPEVQEVLKVEEKPIPVDPTPKPVEPTPPTPILKKPDAPSNIRFEDVGQDEITLIWDAVHNADAYRVYNLDSGEPQEEVLYFGGLSYTDKLLQPNKTYHYAVEAINSAGSTFSDFFAVHTKQAELKPTEENPVIAEILHNTTPHIKWLPDSNAVLYNVKVKHAGGRSYVNYQNTTDTEIQHVGVKGGYHAFYAISAIYEDKTTRHIGSVEVIVPELPELLEPTPFPEGDIPIKETYYIEVTDANADNTEWFIEKLKSIPNGTPDGYILVVFKDEKIRAEGNLEKYARGYLGAINLSGRRFMKFYSETMVTFYTTSPAVEWDTSIEGNTFSKRHNFMGLGCNNLIFENIRVEGANTIVGVEVGTSDELTPKWWYRKFKAGVPVPQWFLDKHNISIEDIKEGDLVPVKPDTGSIRGAAIFKGSWEQEHGFDFRNSSFIRFINCHVYGVFGDGFYAHHATDIDFYNCTVDMTGRQGFGFSNYVFRLKLDGCKSLRPRRSAFDCEPMEGKPMSDIEVMNCHFEGHIAMGGSGPIHNFYFHHNIFMGSYIRFLGGEGDMTRKNCVVTDNRRIGSYHSPAAMDIFNYVEGLVYERNTNEVGTNQGRYAVLAKNCSKSISIQDNNFIHASRIVVADPKVGTEINIHNNLPKAENDTVTLRNGTTYPQVEIIYTK